MPDPVAPKDSLVHVMVVDDEPSILQSITLHLERNGYVLLGATNGESCLAALRKGFKGIILMDVNMAGMDGWSTIQAIVSENLIKGNVICMLTVEAQPDSRGVQLESYVVDYLAKPFTSEQLLSTVISASAFLKP